MTMMSPKPDFDTMHTSSKDDFFEKDDDVIEEDDGVEEDPDIDSEPEGEEKDEDGNVLKESDVEIMVKACEMRKKRSDYAPSQTSRGNKPGGITLTGVDWSGFPGAAHISQHSPKDPEQRKKERALGQSLSTSVSLSPGRHSNWRAERRLSSDGISCLSPPARQQGRPMKHASVSGCAVSSSSDRLAARRSQLGQRRKSGDGLELMNPTERQSGRPQKHASVSGCANLSSEMLAKRRAAQKMGIDGDATPLSPPASNRKQKSRRHILKTTPTPDLDGSKRELGSGSKHRGLDCSRHRDKGLDGSRHRAQRTPRAERKTDGVRRAKTPTTEKKSPTAPAERKTARRSRPLSGARSASPSTARRARRPVAAAASSTTLQRRKSPTGSQATAGRRQASRRSFNLGEGDEGVLQKAKSIKW